MKNYIVKIEIRDESTVVEFEVAPFSDQGYASDWLKENGFKQEEKENLWTRAGEPLLFLHWEPFWNRIVCCLKGTKMSAVIYQKTFTDPKAIKINNSQGSSHIVSRVMGD